MINTTRLEYLCNKLSFSEKDKNTIFEAISKASNERIKKIEVYQKNIENATELSSVAAAAAENCEEEGLNVLIGLLLASEKTEAKYHKIGIPDEIFYNTLEDIVIWASNFKEDTDFLGLHNVSWLENHLSCNLFTLGRLQFAFDNIHLDKETEKKVPSNIKDGDKALGLHIPQGTKLDYDECEASFLWAYSFFPEYFPDFDFKGCVCGSWLLAPPLKEIMPASSNIIRFQNRFMILSTNEDDPQAKERIFGRKYMKMESFPVNTSLQKVADAYLKSGKKIGSGYGIILRNNEE